MTGKSDAALTLLKSGPLAEFPWSASLPIGHLPPVHLLLVTDPIGPEWN